MNRTGFTLIEMLIVVVIIGLLAAIAIPKFGNRKEKAYIASMKSDLRNLVTAEEAYFADSTAYTEQTDCNTPPAPGSVAWCPSRGNTLDKLKVRQGGWTARMTSANTSMACGIYVGGGPIPAGEAVGSRSCAGVSIAGAVAFRSLRIRNPRPIATPR